MTTPIKRTKRVSSTRAVTWLPMDSAPTDGSMIVIKYDAWDLFTRSPDGRTPVRPSIHVEIGYYDRDEESPWRSADCPLLSFCRPLGWSPIPEVTQTERDEVAQHWQVHAIPHYPKS